MKHVVEVAHLVSGEVVSVKRLSARREHAGARSAVVLVLGGATLAMLVSGVLSRALGRALYAPGFVGVWVLAAALVSWFAAHGVSRRLRRYAIGARLDADAFAPVDVELVRRERDGFYLTIVPGMRGHVETGRKPTPVEALVGGAPRSLAFGEDGKAELQLGTSTFVVRGHAETSPAAAESALSRELWRPFSRLVLVGLQVSLVASLFWMIPTGRAIDDNLMRSLVPRITTPWDAEKWLRIEAQAQAPSLYQCFEALPLSCQHAGYVGVGVSLNRDGEVRSNWISRSTYGADCPVDQCMKDVVGTWVFDPLPEPMRVILPVQVLRTEKPLPTKVADARGFAPLGDLTGGR